MRATRGNTAARGKAAIAAEPQLEKLLDVKQACEVLGIGRTKFFALIAQEGLPVLRLDRVIRVRPAALASWILEQERSA